MLGLLGSQLHKQRLLNGQMGLNTSQAQHMNNSNLLHTSNNSQNSRLQNYFQHQQHQPTQNSTVDDELGKFCANNFIFIGNRWNFNFGFWFSYFSNTNSYRF